MQCKARGVATPPNYNYVINEADPKNPNVAEKLCDN